VARAGAKRGQAEGCGDSGGQDGDELQLGRQRGGLCGESESDEHGRVDDERAVGRGRHAPGERPEGVAAAAEVPNSPQRDAGGQHRLVEGQCGGLPVPATLEAMVAAVGEEAACDQEHRQRERTQGAGGGAAPREARRECLEPAAASRGGAEREQDRVLGKDRQLQVELLRAKREGEAHGE
jgi:hypothetical protein